MIKNIWFIKQINVHKVSNNLKWWDHFDDMAINEADEKQSSRLESNLPEQIKRKNDSFVQINAPYNGSSIFPIKSKIKMLTKIKNKNNTKIKYLRESKY